MNRSKIELAVFAKTRRSRKARCSGAVIFNCTGSSSQMKADGSNLQRAVWRQKPWQTNHGKKNMQIQLKFSRALFSQIFFGLIFWAATDRAGNYTNFDVAIYIPVGVVQSFANPQKLA